MNWLWKLLGLKRAATMMDVYRIESQLRQRAMEKDRLWIEWYFERSHLFTEQKMVGTMPSITAAGYADFDDYYHTHKQFRAEPYDA